MPLVADSRLVEVPGLTVVDFLQRPELSLARSRMCCRRRGRDERPTLVVLHTTHGWPDHEHHTPQRVRDQPAGPRDLHAEEVVRDWTSPTAKRFAGAHLVVDADGTVYCCADLVRTAAYHAGHANGCSVGVEFVQQRDASLHRAQVDAVAPLCATLCDLLHLPRRVAYPYRGPRPGILAESGVAGHRDLTDDRSPGDPGDFLLGALVAAGWEAF